MRKYQVLFLLMVFVWPLVLSAQADDAWRNKNWNPKKGKYFFNKVLTWKYQGEMAEDSLLQEGIEIRIYVDEKTGTFLFTPEAYVFSGPMVDFVIADQKGNYIAAYTVEHGKKIYEVFTVEGLQTLLNSPDSIPENFNQFFVPTHQKTVFGKNIYGWPIITGEEYHIVFPDMDEMPTVVNIAPMPYSFLPLYMYKNLAIEAQLPFHFDYAEMIPSHYILLSEYTEYYGAKTQLWFDSLADTEYYIDLSAYKKMN